MMKKWLWSGLFVILAVCLLGIPTRFNHTFSVSDVEGNVSGKITVQATRWRFLLFKDRLKGTVMFTPAEEDASPVRYTIQGYTPIRDSMYIKDAIHMIAAYGYDAARNTMIHTTLFLYDRGDYGAMSHAADGEMLALYKEGLTAQDAIEFFAGNRMFFTHSVADTSDDQMRKADEWNAYLTSIADKAEKSISVDFMAENGEHLSRTLYEYITEEGNRFVFSDAKELRAYYAGNGEETVSVDPSMTVKSEKDAVEAFGKQFGMVVPDLNQFEIVWASDEKGQKEVMLEKNRGDYLRDRVLIQVEKDGKVASFVLYRPKADSYTEEQFSHDYGDAVARLKELQPELDHCELEALSFDTYDNGVCAAEFLIDCTYIGEIDGRKTETYSMEKMLYIIEP